MCYKRVASSMFVVLDSFSLGKPSKFPLMTTSNFQPESRGTLFRIRHVTQGSHTLIAVRHLVPQGVFHIYSLFTLVWISWWVRESHFLLWFNFFSYSLNSKWIKLHHYKLQEMTESAYWPDTSRVGVINGNTERRCCTPMCQAKLSPAHLILCFILGCKAYWKPFISSIHQLVGSNWDSITTSQ